MDEEQLMEFAKGLKEDAKLSTADRIRLLQKAWSPLEPGEGELISEKMAAVTRAREASIGFTAS